jgi:predicted histone-like DNA-binding protein
MSVIFRTVERPSDPRVENSPKKYYPQLVTLGQSVDLAFIAQKMQDRSSLSIGDIKSTMQNFVEKLKEQVNIAGLGVFILAAKSKGEEKADDVTAKSVESVRICFQANRELKISKAATRAGERLDLVSLDDYLKGKTSIDGGSGSEGGGSDSDGDQGENPLG